MIRTLPIALLLAAVPLAGCSPDAQAPVDGETTPAGTDDAATRTVGEGSMADAQGEGPTRAAPSADRTVRLTSIPAPFQGVWDHVEGPCAAASDLRLEIGARDIEFYESVGEVTEIRLSGDADLLVSLDMSGEGQTWDETLLLRLTDNDTRLLVGDPENPADLSEYPRQRCPA
ncbi:hypothetical protein [Qipengyuania sp. JC766]|uniref:hypothetical protein n=1 Tax=Qipengyuania sp. JC766 TaxID=3232139 RepID=UPI003459B927